MRKKVLLINLPGISSVAPPISLATLKGAIKPYHDVTCFDLNLYVNKAININEDFGSFHNDNKMQKIQFCIENFLLRNKIGMVNYDVIGISILSQWQERLAHLTITLIKKYKHCKIVTGGPYFVYSNAQNFNLDFYKKNVDAYIVGDGEISLKEYLNDNLTYPGINSYKYDIKFDRNTLPFPDYDDFNIKDYTEFNIAQSKGCVRKCAFCTVPAVWPKYVYKESNRMVQEIIFLYKNYLHQLPTNSKKIQFVDSLINGSKKLLIETSTQIIRYFGKNHDKFYYGGQAIATSKNHIPFEAYQLAAQAGLRYLITGVETGSEKVRWEMNKRFTDDDLINLLEICKTCNIKFVPLMLIGFPTETETDFQKTLDLLDIFVQYGISWITPRTTSLMSLGPNMAITIDPNKYKIQAVHNSWHWTSEFHDLDERVNRIFRYAQKAQELGLSSLDPDEFVKGCIPNLNDVYTQKGFSLVN